MSADTSSRLTTSRVVRDLVRFRLIGATPNGGVTRIALSPEDLLARRCLVDLMRDAGLQVTIDAAANVIGTMGSSAPGPAVVVGSHIDTVVDGGWLDGVYGVLAGIEVARRVRGERHDLARPLRVVAFTDEEGTTCPRPMWGSRAVMGGAPGAHQVAGPVAAAGGDVSKLADAWWSPDDVGCYVELHIEQGPVLEAGHVPIGIVRTIAGRTLLDITATGPQQHVAGPGPPGRDALAAAARLVLAVPGLRSELVPRAAVSTLDVHPNLRNVVPGRARVGGELRSLDGRAAERACDELRRLCRELTGAGDVSIEVAVDQLTVPTSSDGHLRSLIEESASDLAFPVLELDSLAGHDAQIVGSRVPMAMIFVPSREGVSHSPLEHTDDADLAAGVDVLHRTVRRALGLPAEQLP